MTIRQTAYHTFIGAPYREASKKVSAAIQDAQMHGAQLVHNYPEYCGAAPQTSDATPLYTGALVTHGSPAEALIAPFVFPLLVEDATAARSGQKYWLAGDGRPFMRANRDAAERCRVVNQMEFELLRVLMAANLLWLRDGPHHLLNMGAVMGQVYCRWLADTIGKRFELDGTARLQARVLAAYFFQCNFIDNHIPSEQQKAAMVAQACRSAGVPLVEFESLLADIDLIESAEDFVACLKRVLDTPRLDSFNIGLLSQIMQGTWFGFNGRELACAAIEHPPTFAALLYMSYAQNSYRKAPLAQTSENFKGPKGALEFVRNMQLQLHLR